jgi:prevent-host-death family protein
MLVRNISEAKAELSALIEEVQKGNEVILAEAGKPVARLVAWRGPVQPRAPRLTGRPNLDRAGFRRFAG